MSGERGVFFNKFHFYYIFLMDFYCIYFSYFLYIIFSICILITSPTLNFSEMLLASSVSSSSPESYVHIFPIKRSIYKYTYFQATSFKITFYTDAWFPLFHSTVLFVSWKYFLNIVDEFLYLNTFQHQQQTLSCLSFYLF